MKVIDKLRFPTKQESQLRNEVAILQVTTGVCGTSCTLPQQGLSFFFLSRGNWLSQGGLPGGGNMCV